MPVMPDLSEKSRAILDKIAHGWSYAQIVDQSAGLSYPEIFAAAKEALLVLSVRSQIIGLIRETYPRAYEPWEHEEDQRLHNLFEQGCSPTELSRLFERSAGAIEARLRRNGLLEREGNSTKAQTPA